MQVIIIIVGYLQAPLDSVRANVAAERFAKLNRNLEQGWL